MTYSEILTLLRVNSYEYIYSYHSYIILILDRSICSQMWLLTSNSSRTNYNS